MGKFIIHAEPAESIFPVTPKYIVHRNDRCIACGRCAIRCIYGAHFRSPADYRKMAEPDSTKCKRCHVCVQDCPQKALTITLNEEYISMGDELFTPDIITSCMREGETGKNPVSGGGYGGRFSGKGFDSFWTDMSEIVRPTRDGIHAREYISTSVEIGRKPQDVSSLSFDELGTPLTNIPPSIEINLPILFDLTTLTLTSPELERAVAETAAELRTLAFIRRDRLGRALEPFASYMIESFKPEEVPWGELVEIGKERGIIELRYSPSMAGLPLSLRKVNPDLIVAVRLEEPDDPEGRVREIYQAGGDIIHLRSRNDLPGKIRAAHRALVQDGVRDEVTLIASGGIAEASHVPKAIILGADAVAIDQPFMSSLGCILCGACNEAGQCPRKLQSIQYSWGAKRITNLMASWHNQLLEILGAMGMREVSRLRGEVGRAIFFDDLEKELVRDLEQNKKSL